MNKEILLLKDDYIEIKQLVNYVIGLLDTKCIMNDDVIGNIENDIINNYEEILENIEAMSVLKVAFNSGSYLASIHYYLLDDRDTLENIDIQQIIEDDFVIDDNYSKAYEYYTLDEIKENDENEEDYLYIDLGLYTDKITNVEIIEFSWLFEELDIELYI